MRIRIARSYCNNCAARSKAARIPVRLTSRSAFASRRNAPEIDARSRYARSLFRFPVSHVESVGDDSRSRPELLQKLGLELFVKSRQQIERDYARLADVGLEQVAFDELDLVGDPRCFRVRSRFADALRIDVDADRARTVLLRGGNDDAAIAATEVVYDIVRRHLGELQHLLDDFVRR